MRKRRDLEDAKICLEEWAKYMEDTNGFPSRSPTDKFGELKAHRAESSLPTNIEPNNRTIEHAMLVLAIMSDSSSRSKGRADVLKSVSRSICNDESIEQAMERLGIEKAKSYYFDALDEFAMRLEVVTYGTNVEINQMAKKSESYLEN